MKKFIAIVATLLILVSSMAVNVMASAEGIIENPPINVPAMSPTIDGTINENEGWSVSALMNYDTLGFYWHVNPLTMDGNVRFAWDNDNLYYCGKIVDGLETHHEITGELIPAGYNQFLYSEGEDWIDVNPDNPADNYGFDGDIFGIIIDPLSVMLDAGYNGNQDYTPWYLIGLFEGDVAKMYRNKINEGEITDQVKVAGHKTTDGWHFEAAIPWDIIIKDVEDITFGECVIDKADLLKENAYIRLGAMYHDRFDDPEAGERSTWGRFVTCPTTLATGMSGNGSSGDNVLSCGINLYLQAPEGGQDTTAPNGDEGGQDTTTATPDGDDNTSAETETAFVEVTDDKGNAVTDASGNKVTQKVTVKVTSKATSKATAKATTKKATTGTTTGGNAAQTFDIGIAIALGALATSGIGFVATKKRK
ncbi:MAG: hypothetical protein IJA55_09185 [Clostridia bacterium]|nr:hypothetical protein [Clostridia bacterium]